MPERDAILGIAVAMGALVFVASCSWSVPPDRSDAIIRPMRVSTASVEDAQETDLYLAPSGLWIWRDDQAAAHLRPGRLLAIIEPDDHGHLFAVVLTRSWGAMLQKIDRNTIKKDLSVATWTVIEGAAQWPDACEVTTQGIDPACAARAPEGARWDVFAIAAERRLRVEHEADERRTLPPVWPRAIAERDAQQGSRLVVGAWPARGVAYRHPPMAGGRAEVEPAVAAHVQCPERPVWRARFDQAVSEDVVAIERIAAQAAGADALVWCPDDGSLVVAAPSAARGWPRAARGPMMAHRAPIVVEARAPDRAIEDVITALAAASRGDVAVATMSLAEALPFIRDRHGAIAAISQLCALAARPGDALWLMQAGVAKTWQPDLDPLYHIAIATVARALGYPRLAMGREQRVADLADSIDDESLAAWLGYRAVAADAARARPGIAHALDQLGAREQARAVLPAAWLVAARANPDQSDEFLARGPKPLTSWVLGRTAPEALPCPKSASCPLDLYGRHVDAWLNARRPLDARALRELATIRPVATRPFAAAMARASHPVEALLLARAAGQRETQAMHKGAHKLGETLFTSDTCTHIKPLLDVYFEDGSALQWLLQRGAPAACAGPDALARALTEEGAPLALGLRLWEGLASHSAEYAALLPTVLELTKRRDAPPRVCGRYQALGALAALRRREQIHPYMDRARACERGQLGREASIIEALYRQEWGRDPGATSDALLSSQIKEIVADHARKEVHCEALREPEIALDDLLDPSFVAITSRARRVDRARLLRDSVTALSRGDLRALAHASLEEAIAALREGDREGFARALGRAEREATSGDHAPTRAKARVLRAIFLDAEAPMALPHPDETLHDHVNVAEGEGAQRRYVAIAIVRHAGDQAGLERALSRLPRGAPSLLCDDPLNAPPSKE